jgi:hypothetical protein
MAIANAMANAIVGSDLRSLEQFLDLNSILTIRVDRIQLDSITYPSAKTWTLCSSVFAGSSSVNQ